MNDSDGTESKVYQRTILNQKSIKSELNRNRREFTFSLFCKLQLENSNGKVRQTNITTREARLIRYNEMRLTEVVVLRNERVGERKRKNEGIEKEKKMKVSKERNGEKRRVKRTFSYWFFHIECLKGEDVRMGGKD